MQLKRGRSVGLAAGMSRGRKKSYNGTLCLSIRHILQIIKDVLVGANARRFCVAMGKRRAFAFSCRSCGKKMGQIGRACVWVCRVFLPYPKLGGT